jgi:GH15 family glucan-1,4-alpha-glucosidase
MISSTSWPTSRRPSRESSRSCTGSAARASCRNRISTTSPATTARARCASATTRTDRTSTTSWGAILDSFYLHTKSRDQLPERIWPILVKRVESALAHWRWQSAADEIKADICANALDDRGVFCQHYASTALDASVLLMPLVRFLPPHDERIRKTVLAIADELTVDGLVLRYLTDETDDGLSGREGTFTICSFWLVSALVEARDLCEKLLSYASPLQLYAEEIDPQSGRHLGNFPQAFTHLALINAVMHIIRAEQGVEVGAFPSGLEPSRQQSEAW